MFSIAFEVMKFLDVVSPCTGCSLRRGTPGFLAESPYEKLPGAGRTVFDAPLRRYSPGAERVTGEGCPRAPRRRLPSRLPRTVICRV